MAKEKIKISGGASGIIAVILTLLFGFIGAFFSWWLIARWNILKSFFIFFCIFLGIFGKCVIVCYFCWLHFDTHCLDSNDNNGLSSVFKVSN